MSAEERPSSLETQIAELATSARRKARRWKRLESATRALKNDVADVVGLHEAADVLEADAPDDDSAWEELREEARRRADRARMKAAMKLSSGLQSRAEEADLAFARTSDSPLVFGIGDYSVACDVAGGRAEVLYGREPCAEVDCAPAKIFDELDTVRKRHGDWRSAEATDVFDRMRRAYAMLVAAAGGGSSDRVPLVDLIPPLAMVVTSATAWRKGGVGSLDDFPRERLVVELHHLRRSGMLERDGQRLDLGVATGDSTSDKSDVLFVPTSGSDGQYYATIRFEEVRS